jgi:hypothetical protein
MGQFLGFGNGEDGEGVLTGTHAPIDASCSGTVATNTLAATNVAFAAGQIILIHQTRGANAGQWELNKIDSYAAGIITTLLPLSFTYVSLSSDKAQVIVVPQYSGLTMSNAFTLKAWDGDVGGLSPFMVSGVATLSEQFIAKQKGYLCGRSSEGSDGEAGEGTAGPRLTQRTDNGSGGGGGLRGPSAGTVEGGHAAGGGNAADAGDAGGKHPGLAGEGGDEAGNAALTLMVPGGGGGAGGDSFSGAAPGGQGGNGGGMILIFASKIVVTAAMDADGGAGDGNNNDAGAGAGGAGGSIFLKAVEAIIGTDLITARGGIGGTSTGAFNGKAGDGSAGRIRIEACKITGSTIPSANTSEGGHPFCGSANQIL